MSAAVTQRRASLRLGFGGYGGSEPAVTATAASIRGEDLKIERVTNAADLPSAAGLCVQSFFGESRGNPFKASNLRKLETEQLMDLADKFDKGPESTTFFKAVASDEDGEPRLVGFVELTLSTTIKFLGDGIPPADVRPLLANLAVAPSARCQGLGGALVRACEADARRRGFAEVVLQVEEDNGPARDFYAARGYELLFCDPAARRYAAGGFTLRNVRTSRMTLRKVFQDPQAGAGGRNGEDPGELFRRWAEGVSSGFAEALGRFSVGT